ncbi:MAG: type II CAAX endopeptidase family protein [Cyclobacteriaceae bacterium]
MKTIFIQQSREGRNPWYAIPVLLLSSAGVIILLNQLINRALLPVLKSAGLVEVIGKELITYLFIFVVFSALTGVLYVIYRRIHQRPFRYLINTGKDVRWQLFGKGFLLWGGLLFASMLLLNGFTLTDPLSDRSISRFVLLAIVTGVSLFIQTFWEELLFRGYLLQGAGRKFARLWLANGLISLLFALAHFGYGLENLFHSFIFSVVITLITLNDEGIERAAGIHFANNWLILLFFTDVNEVVSSTFSWEVDGADLGLFILCQVILLVSSVGFSALTRLPGLRAGKPAASPSVVAHRA